MKPLKNKMILVVDDEELLREIISEELTYCGATVDTAENGLLALAKLKTNFFDCLVTDIRMPGGNGVDLIKSIGTELEKKPIIFICSGFNDLNSDDLKKLNVAYHFTKPFNRDQFIEIISDRLGLTKIQAG